MKDGKKLLVLLLVLVMVLSLAACGGNSQQGTNGEKENGGETSKEEKPAASNSKSGPAVDKDTVVICTADETPSLTTAGHNAVAGSYINELTHNGLFKLDKELNPAMDLVASYEVEKDENGEETIWYFTLHEGIKFHDGSVMNVDDVIASLEHAQESPDVQSYTQSYNSLEKVDDLTLKLTTDGPSSSLLYDLSHHGNYVIPKAEVEKAKDDPEVLNNNPIGAGPYKFVKWNRGEQLEFTAHEDYFNAERAPKIKNIVWKIIPEGNARAIAIEAGDVDYIIETDSTSVAQLDANSNLVVMKVPSVAHSWLCVNNEAEPFDDVNVRKAVNAAINKEDIIEVALNGAGIVAASQTPTGMLGEYTGDYDLFDLDLAKSYMEAWGGDPSTIKLDMICSDDTKRRAAEVIQANLKEIGINATISSMDLATYLSETADGNFTGFIGGYRSNEMMSFLKGVYLSSNIGSSNKTRVNIPELDELIIKATKTIDQDERGQVLQDATKLLNELCPQMPLYQNNILSTHKAELKNTFITTSGTFYAQEWEW